MKKIWGFFSSITLTVILAGIICAVAATGSIITIRNPSIMSYLDHKVLIYGLKELSGQFEVYWIILLTIVIAIFAVNTFVCTLDKITSIVKNHGSWKRLIPQIVHIGFFIALTGHLVGSVAGFKTSGNVLFQGVPTPVPAVNNLSVRLDDFRARNDSFGYRDYLKTTVSLFRNGEKILTRDIAVNHPLIYKGIAFYHKDDGTAPTGIRVKRGGLMEELSFNDEPSSGKERRLKITGLYPDFAIDSGGAPFSRSERFNNPHARLTMGNKSVFLSLGTEGSTASIGGETIEFAGFSLSPYVVLSINKDPGIWLIIIGSLILLGGMVLLLIFGGGKAELIRETNLREKAATGEG